MTTLLVGFDSAWTATNSGGIISVLKLDNGTFVELEGPLNVNYVDAEHIILKWQAERMPTATIVLLDQPTIVTNVSESRPVDKLVGSPVGRRYGGTQSAYTGKKEMFGDAAPVWRFLKQFGDPADPLDPVVDTRVFETYPVLAMIALGWTLEDSRKGGRLPKYNPERKKSFRISDWRYVCKKLSEAFHNRGLTGIVQWIDSCAHSPLPRKRDQDCIDACMCLLVAMHLAEQKDCLMVGDLQTGYIVVPYSQDLCVEFDAYCNRVPVKPSAWRKFQLPPLPTARPTTSVSLR